MDKQTAPVRIEQCHITELPKSLFDPMPKVMIRFAGQTEFEELFEYYPDEISFSAWEFVGLTKEQAYNLKFKKDKNYLKS
jgi:hypothetical protein